MDILNDPTDKILLYFQIALLGEIPPALRAVTVSQNDLLIDFYCYFDGAVSEDDDESMSCVETEMMAFLPVTYAVQRHVVRIDFPEVIPKNYRCVYSRRENL